MHITFKMCKFYWLLCLGLTTASPIMTGLKTTQPNFESEEFNPNLQPASDINQSLKNIPVVTKTFRDQNGNIVTQVKKEIVNNNNGQNSHTSEFEETKQLPNGYSKSFKKEYSSSSVIEPKPIILSQTPITYGKYNNGQQLLNNRESTLFGQTSQNYQGLSTHNVPDNFGINSNLQSTIGQSMTNVPGVTTTFRDQYGNIVTQVKKETVNNNNGQNSHISEFEETKQLPNGYSKSFKKEYSSSSVIEPQPITLSHTPINNGKYYNGQQSLNNRESTLFGQTSQKYQGLSPPDNFGINSNLQSTIGQSMTNVPGVTTTFRDQYGNIVTQVKKETVNNDNGQNSHISEFEETKQLPNGYSKSFKKEYSSSSVIEPKPITLSQTPINNGKYYNGQQSLNNRESTSFGQTSQNYQRLSTPDNYGINSNLQSTIGQSMTNVPGVTTTFRDQYGNIVTQVKKETVNNNNGQNSHISEFEETKQLPNGYSKSFKKEYSSSSVIEPQPIILSQTPITNGKYHNGQQLLNNRESTSFGQTSQNYQGLSTHNVPDNFGINSNLQSTIGQSITNVPGVTTTFRDQYGNIVTQVKKETINNNNGQNSHISEFEETKQFPNGYSKSFKKEYSSSSAIDSYPTFVKETTEKNTFSPQKVTNEGLERFNGYNTFFNDKKYPLAPTDPINSQVINNKKIVTQKYNIKDETDCEETDRTSSSYQSFKPQMENLNTFSTPIGQRQTPVNYSPTPKAPSGQKFEKIESFSSQTQEVGQQSVDLHEFSKPSPVGQQPVFVNYFTTPKPPSGQQFEKIETFSSQTQKVGQQSVDLDEFSKPSPVGQQSVTVNQFITPKTPSGQKFEKIESFSSQTQEVGQQSVDLHEFSKPSPVGQQPVFVNYFTTPKPPSGQQFEKIETFSSQTQKVGQQSVDLDEFSKPSPVGQQSVTVNQFITPKTPSGQKFEKIESFSSQTQEIGQQSVDLHEFSKPSPIGQQPVLTNYFTTPKTPKGQQFEKIETFSSQTQKVGQQSVDLDEFSKPSSVGQQSVGFNQFITPKTPSGQKFEKIESFSSQTQEIGQQSVDLHEFSKPSPIGQQPVLANYFTTPKPPSGQQFEKIESFSSQTQNSGQQSVDLDEFSKPSPVGQQSVGFNQFISPKTPSGQKFEKIESFSSQTQEVGQQSVDLHEFSKPSPVGQQPVFVNYFTTPKTPKGQQFEKIETFSPQTQEVGQQSVDLHEFSKPSPVGQQSVGFNQFISPKTPSGQKFEKIESFSSQTQEVGQQSVDLHEFSKPSPVGQQSVTVNQFITPKTPSGQKFEKIESFSSQTQEVGQHSVDLDEFSKPSPVGQQSVGFNEFISPKTPSGQQFEKIESFSSQTQEVGQQSVDLHEFSKPSSVGQQSVGFNQFIAPKTPSGQQFEKIESSYQNKYNSGQHPVNINENSKISQQNGMSQSSGQQIQGLEFLTTDFGDTTHLLDLGSLGQQSQQPTGYTKETTSGHQVINNGRPIGQQTTVFEKHSALEKNIDLSNPDQTTIDNYQQLHRQSLKNPVFNGQQTVDYTSDFEGHKPIYQKQYNDNVNFQKSEYSSHTENLGTGKDQPINSKYNSVFDKLNQLEHEITGSKSTVNINKDNFKTSYSTNHNVKSMPVQTHQQEFHFSSTANEETQYIEPESEMISSSSSVKESKSTVQLDTIENHTSINEHILEQPTTQSTVWRRIGDKFKGSIQNVKDKAQQLASNINDKFVK